MSDNNKDFFFSKEVSETKWFKLNCDTNPEELCIHGPMINVDIQSINSSVKINNIIALIDTGAAYSCISTEVANKLGVIPDKESSLSFIGAKPISVPIFRCKLFFPIGINTVCDFAVIPHIRLPHQLVIGYDILYNTRFTVDFTTGKWELHFKIPK